MNATKLVLCFFIGLLVSCQSEPEYSKINGHTMGTTYQVTADIAAPQTAKLADNIEKRLADINQLMSTYIEDSELSQFNQTHSTECLPLSHETREVIQASINISKQTAGKFDVTIAPLIDIWGFDKTETHNQIPSPETIAELLNTIGFDKILMGSDCVAKKQAQLSINLSAIAKGYAVDQIANLVRQYGSENYLVEIGGEVALRGVNPKGAHWRIAVESANGFNRSIQKVVTPKGLGVATSGDYRNYFEKNGQRYSHTIDPTTGSPIKHRLASITVLHPQTMLADAYATAMMVIGPEDSLKLAEKLNLPIFMLVKTDSGFKEVYNDAFSPYISH